MAEIGQRTSTPFKIRGGDITEHQRPVCEMRVGELGFDARLALMQPIHRRIELIDGGRLEAEFLA
jgi:hypothetical protein